MVDYKPFFWNDMIEGKYAGGYQISGTVQSSHIPSAPSKGGRGREPSETTLERFRDLVVPVGFVLINENNAPRKYNEHSNVETIDDAMFDKLFNPLLVNKSIKKRTTKKNKQRPNPI